MDIDAVGGGLVGVERGLLRHKTCKKKQTKKTSILQSTWRSAHQANLRVGQTDRQ